MPRAPAGADAARPRGRGGVAGRGRARSRPSTASIPRPSCPRRRPSATARSFDDMVAHNRRSAEIAFRHLARPRGAQAPHRGRRAARPGRGDRPPARRADAGHGRASSSRIHDIEEGAPCRSRALDDLDALGAEAARMNVDLAGRTALVTGAAHGFGRAIALALAARRRRRSSPATSLEDGLPETAALAGARCTARRARRDRRGGGRGAGRRSSTPAARRSTSWSTMPAACWARSAGRSRRSTRADWQAIFDVNLTGAFLMAQAVAPGMKAARLGPHRQHLVAAPGSASASPASRPMPAPRPGRSA